MLYNDNNVTDSDNSLENEIEPSSFLEINQNDLLNALPKYYNSNIDHSNPRITYYGYANFLDETSFINELKINERYNGIFERPYIINCQVKDVIYFSKNIL